MVQITQLKTKRLRLVPMALPELEQKVARMEAGELRQAYGQMLDGCREYPASWLWYTPWKIIRREDGVLLGDLCFKGPPVRGTVEWGYGLEEPFRGQGYMTEAARVLLDWAFGQKDVYAVEAETLAENAASQRVLTKLDFKPTGVTGEEGPRFRREKQAAKLSVVYLSVGMCFGISVGMSLGNMAIGMLFGMAIGFALGTAMDTTEKKHRQLVLSGRNQEETP